MMTKLLGTAVLIAYGSLAGCAMTSESDLPSNDEWVVLEDDADGAITMTMIDDRDDVDDWTATLADPGDDPAIYRECGIGGVTGEASACGNPFPLSQTCQAARANARRQCQCGVAWVSNTCNCYQTQGLCAVCYTDVECW